MTWNPLKIRNLYFLGPKKPPVSLEFRSGVNVICGASDTGKSFIVEALVFLLGGQTPLRDIHERVGYDRAFIGIETAKQELFTVERSVKGGNYRRYKGLIEENTLREKGTDLKAKHEHNQDDNLSGWLLSNIGLYGRRIQKNQSGKTQSLGFRNLAQLTIVDENEIIKKESPFLTGQYVNKTSEQSALKVLLTGIDDSALIPKTKKSQVCDNSSVKIELIEQFIGELSSEVEGVGINRNEIDLQLGRLEESLVSQRISLQQVQKRLDDSIVQRKDILEEREKISGRIDEIKNLLARFNILTQHYAVDIERLLAIEESGSLFVHQEKAACPLCGALPNEQHIELTCEGEVEVIVDSAKAEIEKIKKLSVELQQTINDLRSESSELVTQLSAVDGRYRTIDNEIRETIAPDVEAMRTTYSDLVEKRGEVKRLVDLFVRIDSLERRKSDLINETTPSDHSVPLHTDLSMSVLNKLSKRVENILQTWNFPRANGVYFDENTFDFVINGKPRGSLGKGLRAITHAAVSIALMEYCKDCNSPHPGFVVLDSPLLAYWAPEGEEDSLQGTDLKDKFYQYLTSNHHDTQVIIIENEHPTEAYADKISLTVFTKNPNSGRYGFFPYQAEIPSNG